MNARRGIELVILEIMRERSRLRDVLACALEPRCYVPNASHVRPIVAARVGAEMVFDGLSQGADVELLSLGHDDDCTVLETVNR